MASARVPPPLALLLSLAVALLLLAAAAAAQPGPAPAATVSPGDLDHAVEIATPCPAFSWAAVDGAAAYELAVLDLERPEEPRVALRHTVAGRGLSWTPGRAECLAVGEYAWTVRALDAAGAPLGGEAAWAPPRRFAVSALPSDAEVAAALDVLRRWQGGRGPGAEAGPASSASLAHRNGEAVEISGAAAIRGENPAVAGDQHGVWGQTSSASGAGLVAVNLAGGPDLVLDGAGQGQADTRLSESGLDRSSASAQTFNVYNSGGGSMSLLVGGQPVWHGGNDGAGSGLDADTLDGLHASGLSALGHNHFGETWSGGGNWGLLAWNSQSGGVALEGLAGSASGYSYGVHGDSSSTQGRGVYGTASAATGLTYGVFGSSNSLDGRGVHGWNQVASGSPAVGVRGESSSTEGVGVFGAALATTGSNHGVVGSSSSPGGTGAGGYAYAASGATTGVHGFAFSTGGTGVLGWAAATSGTTYGVWGRSNSPDGHALYGHAEAATGINYGVEGLTASTFGRGVMGKAYAGSGTTYGVWGEVSSPSGYAGYFVGRTHVEGDLSATGTKAFRIDHPLDPEQRYLLHFAAESSEVLNLYTGNAVLDASGAAWVEMPAWFAAINRDLRYQLTALDRPQPNLYVAERLAGNRFRIAGGEPGGAVSWTVTALRADPWVRDHPPATEVEKVEGERGRYLYPAGYGQPEERGLNWEAHEQDRRARELAAERSRLDTARREAMGARALPVPAP